MAVRYKPLMQDIKSNNIYAGSTTVVLCAANIGSSPPKARPRTSALLDRASEV